MKKIIFLVIWIFILLISLFTLLKVTPLSYALGSKQFLANFIERGLGLLAFGMLFTQIILGSFMDSLSKKLGGWILNFHIFEGATIYLFAFLHPVFYLLKNYFYGAKFDPYVAFVNVCLICKTPTDYYLTIGRVAFLLMTLAVFAAIFKKATPWLKQNWRKFHVLNYIVFLAIGIHGFLFGTDFRFQPFYTFAILAYAVIVGIVIFIELPRFYRNFVHWVNS